MAPEQYAFVTPGFFRLSLAGIPAQGLKAMIKVSSGPGILPSSHGCWQNSFLSGAELLGACFCKADRTASFPLQSLFREDLDPFFVLGYYCLKAYLIRSGPPRIMCPLILLGSTD